MKYTRVPKLVVGTLPEGMLPPIIEVLRGGWHAKVEWTTDSKQSLTATVAAATSALRSFIRSPEPDVVRLCGIRKLDGLAHVKFIVKFVKE